MKRHGDNPNLPARPIPAAKFGQPITELVNGTFRVPAVSSPFFWQKVAPINNRDENFEEP
jgi:hypothetical protein